MERNQEYVNNRKVMSAREAKLKLDEIKVLLKSGQMSYEEAKETSSNALDNLNRGMEVIAKEHGFKCKKVSFASYMR